MVWKLAAWLHLTGGLSVRATATAVKFLFALVLHAMRLGSALHAAGLPNHLKAETTVPAIMSQLSLEPTLIRSICCPGCYTLYSYDTCPDTCPRREHPNSRKHCCAKLWKTDAQGQKKPERLYCTQDFESWLSWFLSRKDIYEAIQTSYSHQRPGNDTMEDIWDSPAWDSLNEFCTTQGNLTFSFYIDWFNPYENKQAGKKVSCGAIIMFCLNLPPHLRIHPSNVYVAGLTPSGKEPDVLTITNVINPVMDQLEPFYTGKTVSTYAHPEGEDIKAGVLAHIGDIPGIQKCGGFASHSAKQFCHYCSCIDEDIETLDHSSWTSRSGFKCRQDAYAWLRATTKKRREELFQENGVRWSALHRLQYRDHINHCVLGIMHNWVEGVLQHHARVIWGIGAILPKKKTKSTFHSSSSQSQDSDLDLDNFSDSPLTHFSTQPSGRHRLHTIGPFVNDNMEVDAQYLHPDPESDNAPETSASESDTSSQSQSNILPPPSVFSKEQLQEIRAGIAETVLPSYLDRPPTNFGEAQHGKLKADHWVTLFTFLLSMSIVDLWEGSPSEHDQELLLNFAQLTYCTFIACSYSTSKAAGDSFDHYYVEYRKGLQKLFPDHHSVPNHHYAMHIGALLAFWGPLFGLSEFAYERMNGVLQRIKTNGKLSMAIHHAALNLLLILSQGILTSPCCGSYVGASVLRLV
jgi:hypothetical protein